MSGSVLQLYRRIAIDRCREGLSEECETARALAIEQTVLDELSRVGRKHVRMKSDDTRTLRCTTQINPLWRF